MRRKALVFVAVLVVAAGIIGAQWFAGRVDRAIFTLQYGSAEEQVEAMRLLAGHVDDNEAAFQAVVDWFESAAHRNPAPEVMFEASRVFARRKPEGEGFAAAVATLQVRGLFPETRTWVDDYHHSPAVTAALLRYLVTSVPSEWPGAEANLQRELRDRPKDAVTLDLALAAWRTERRPAAVVFIGTFDAAVTETRVKATAGSATRGLDEWRLLECQRGRCTSADVLHLINTARIDAAASHNAGQSHRRLEAQQAALGSLGRPAVPALLALYDDRSPELSSFAVATLVEMNEPTILGRLAVEIEKQGRPALNAIGALQTTSPHCHGANRLLLEALSSKSEEISNVALESLRRRLAAQDLVDGVLGYVADRERFSQREVMAYENAIKSAGPNAGSYVADAMTRMLDTAGDPRDLVWIQKVLALHVLRDVGTGEALPLLARLRRDPGGYVWVTTTVTDDGRRDESHREVPFRQASDEAAKAITSRSGNS